MRENDYHTVTDSYRTQIHFDSADSKILDDSKKIAVEIIKSQTLLYKVKITKGGYE